MFAKKDSLSTIIYECYNRPVAFDVRRIIERMLIGLPAKYLDGLDAVILCDIESFKKQYGDEEKISTARYIRTKGEEHRWIEICVDKVIQDNDWVMWKFPPFRDMVLSKELFHEIGHHIHYQNGSLSSSKEDCEAIANKWQKKLTASFLRKKYWYIFPLTLLILPFRNWIRYQCEKP